jgi:hypothetical protein
MLAAAATGFAVIEVVFVLVPPGPVTVNVTIKLPAVVKVCDGFCAALVDPSPKFH